MAKHRDEQQTNGLDAFTLTQGRFMEAESHIGSLVIPSSPNDVKLGKDDLQVEKEYRTTSGGTVKRKEWRFKGDRVIPSPASVDANTTRDELHAIIDRWLDDTVAFDVAQAYVDLKGRTRRKGYKLLETVEDSPKPITPEQYLYSLLTDASGNLALRSNKVMYRKLAKIAEQTMRQELAIADAVKGTRAKKVTDDIIVEEGDETQGL